MRQGYALMAGGSIYTVQRHARDWFTGRTPPGWQAFRDGVSFAHFKSKREFEAFVSLIPDNPPADWNDPQIQAAYVAQHRSEFDGVLMLGRLLKRIKEQGGTNAGTD